MTFHLYYVQLLSVKRDFHWSNRSTIPQTVLIMTSCLSVFKIHLLENLVTVLFSDGHKVLLSTVFQFS